MTLRRLMTDTASTTRTPAISGGKVGEPVTHLQNVKIVPPMLASATSTHTIRQAIGLEGTAVQVWETYSTVHSHTDGGVTVNQLPDMRNGDRLITGGVTYVIKWTEAQPPTTSYNSTLMVYMVEDKRA